MTEDKSVISPGLAVPLALQHMVAMIVGCITVPLVLGSAAKLPGTDLLILMQGSLICAAIAILLHAFRFKRIGSGLPMVVGAGFAFIPTLIDIANTNGMPAVLGAQFVGALVGILVGIFFKQIKFLFPPQVTAPVIITVGISLYKTAVGYMAGGSKSDALFGSSLAWGISIFTLVVVLVLSNYGKGVFKVSATLFGLLIGYLVAFFFGLVDFSQVMSSTWFNIPQPFHFGMEFIPSAIVGMIVIFVINTVKEIGVFEAAASTAYNRLATEKEISGGLIANNISSLFGSILAGVPNANAAQNVGIVGSSKVTARIVFVLTATFILITAFIPKLTAIFLTIPLPVLGGATIMVFGSIMTTGIRVLEAAGMTNRNFAISGLSIALAVGLSQISGALANTPEVIQVLFGGSEIIVVAVAAIILNFVLPKNT
ncbi:solute carrier family 23 protein (plasmid) [Entomospira entomophila]|uniref:Purine/pyrimidine permease n=1 Tax=Entomospira entomophila TaxID=2719988 RepID=A0A968GB78_9SPIO|nr:solute carrier family 23 protein [Entomospira entomophilus]NIZ41332.1 purine/pyrimidine permease [Entomospira entomophilus]WDI36257.1 solute carrier family 23 protein [Entomospira entomophilus]